MLRQAGQASLNCPRGPCATDKAAWVSVELTESATTHHSTTHFCTPVVTQLPWFTQHSEVHLTLALTFNCTEKNPARPVIPLLGSARVDERHSQDPSPGQPHLSLFHKPDKKTLVNCTCKIPGQVIHTFKNAIHRKATLPKGSKSAIRPGGEKTVKSPAQKQHTKEKEVWGQLPRG